MNLHKHDFKVLFFCILVFFFHCIHSQDIHWSQFFASPLSLNPANSGHFEGAWRVSNNYRRQWANISPYTTFSVAFDKPIYGKKNKFGAGIMLLDDISGNSNLNVTGFYLSGSYDKVVGTHHFMLGIQAGIVNKHYAVDQVILPDQYDNSQGFHSSDQATSEPMMRENFIMPDFNTGLIWTKEFGIFKPNLGFGLFHVNRPNQSFLDNNEKLPMRQTLHFSGDIDILDKFYLTPVFIRMTHGGATEMISGTKITYVIARHFQEKSVFCGILTRNEFENFDAMIFLVGLNYKHWEFGVSYDINTSELNTATNYNGGVELSIIYKAISTRIKDFTLPCVRF